VTCRRILKRRCSQIKINIDQNLQKLSLHRAILIICLVTFSINWKNSLWWVVLSFLVLIISGSEETKNYPILVLMIVLIMYDHCIDFCFQLQFDQEFCSVLWHLVSSQQKSCFRHWLFAGWLFIFLLVPTLKSVISYCAGTTSNRASVGQS
jgi:hypothetical protein